MDITAIKVAAVTAYYKYADIFYNACILGYCSMLK
jgi:hypothetical protein